METTRLLLQFLRVRTWSLSTCCFTPTWASPEVLAPTPTMTTSAPRAVGIGADYGIYMSFRMREELNASPDEKAAIEKAFLSAGKAILFGSTAVAGGFGVLMFSFGFMVHIWMGFLISIAMLVSSI